MWWKKKQKKELYDVYIDGDKYAVPEEVYDYIDELEDKVESLEYAEMELKAIKPVLSDAKFDPPVSMNCKDCDFVVLSTWDKAPIGCRKNMLCESFRKKEV
jgi:hypothetical protein